MTRPSSAASTPHPRRKGKEETGPQTKRGPRGSARARPRTVTARKE
ncbi:hypothetical protein E2C01_048150 [Portunus trituberculatus]|uniref:Uncharacterized protein n=1 Tax=Portunus trituberculatus TaxID=210409 RepID=A0A5B7G2D7_PORTR|nr:hypothetical protein [Portunus trituberculatus]